jgi:cysteinyl-tRNA synthetase
LADEEQSRLIPPILSCLDEDLNIAGAWGAIFEWIRETNRRIVANAITAERAIAIGAAWEKIDAILGIGHQKITVIPREIILLLEDREAARKVKNFSLSDQIRDELKAKGWTVKDSPNGQEIKKL